MTEKDLEKAYDLKRKSDKAFEDWQNLIALKDEHFHNLQKDLSLSKIGSGWVRTHWEDKPEVLDLLLKKAKARFDKAIEEFRNYQPKKTII